MTFAIREELDEPSVEAHAVGGPQPDVLVLEAEAGGGEGVGSGEAREHGNIDEPLLERHQQRHSRHQHRAYAIQHQAQVRHHCCVSLRRSRVTAGGGGGESEREEEQGFQDNKIFCYDLDPLAGGGHVTGRGAVLCSFFPVSRTDLEESWRGPRLSKILISFLRRKMNVCDFVDLLNTV